MQLAHSIIHANKTPMQIDSRCKPIINVNQSSMNQPAAHEAYELKWAHSHGFLSPKGGGASKGNLILPPTVIA